MLNVVIKSVHTCYFNRPNGYCIICKHPWGDKDQFNSTGTKPLYSESLEQLQPLSQFYRGQYKGYIYNKNLKYALMYYFKYKEVLNAK